MNRFKISVAMLVVAFLTVGAVAQSGAADKRLEKILEDTNTRMNNLFHPDTPGGVLLISKDGKVIFSEAYGLADVELKVPMSTKNVFSIGSLTKMFTATAVMSLAERGKISLSEDIGKYLPGYNTYGKTITVENLLTHSSGIVDLFSIPEWFKDWPRDVDRKYLINLFEKKPLMFEPGEKCEYSNSNYILLGQIIENVTGKKYFEFMTERFFNPMKIQNTYYPENTNIIPQRAKGYFNTKDGFQIPSHVSYTHLDTAGGIFSNAKDITRFTTAFFNGKTLKGETMKRAFEPYVDKSGTKQDYGYGCFYSEDWNTVDWGGSMLGYEVHTSYMKEEKILIVLLTNISGDHVSSNPYFPRIHVHKIIREIRGTDESMLKPINLKSIDLKNYTGKYKVSQDNYRAVSVRNGRLFSKRSGGLVTELKPLSKTEFFYRDSGPNRYQFVLNKQGRSVELNHLNGKGQVSRAVRVDEVELKKTGFINLPKKRLQTLAGKYISDSGFSFNFTAEKDCLTIHDARMGPKKICPVNESKFIPVDGTNFSITFGKNQENGKPGLTFKFGRMVIKAEKSE